MARTLSPDELKWALEHAAEVHRLAQARRDLAARCTSLDELRQALLESGVPASDVDAALGSLQSALDARRRAATSRRRLALALGLSFVLALGIGALVTSGGQAAPLAFVNLRHAVPGRASFSSWESGGVLGGEAERALAAALQARGITCLGALEEKNVRRLFVGAGVQPTQDALRSATEARVAVLGDAQCSQIEGEAVDGPKTVRSALRVEALELESGRTLDRAEAEGKATDDNLARACDLAATAAMAGLADRLAGQLAAQLGVVARR
jgi:hypothetical protein